MNIDKVYNLGITNFSAKISINSDKSEIYFTISNKVYRVNNINDAEISLKTIISGRNFYTIEIDPFENILYATDAKNFVSKGWVYRYDISANTSIIDSFQVGIIPTYLKFY